MTTFINCERNDVLSVAELAEANQMASVEFLGTFPKGESVAKQIEAYKCVNAFGDTVYIWEGANGGDPAIVAEDDTDGFLAEYGIA